MTSLADTTDGDDCATRLAACDGRGAGALRTICEVAEAISNPDDAGAGAATAATTTGAAGASGARLEAAMRALTVATVSAPSSATLLPTKKSTSGLDVRAA